MKKNYRYKKLFFNILLICLVVAFSSTSVYALGFTFSGLGDNITGDITASSGNYFTLSMQETNYNRAVYGSAFLEGNTAYCGFTKNTSSATVAYQVDINLSTMTGPYYLVVTWGNGTITETSGTATLSLSGPNQGVPDAPVEGE